MSHLVNSLAEHYGTNRHRVVLYAGTFEPYQGLDLLVEAAQQVVRARQNVRFLCAGGNKKQVDSIKNRAEQCRVAEYFIFTGLLSPEEVEHLFKIAAILISPRTSGTNTPLKIYSYLRSGVPIMATNIPSHTQVLTDDVALLVEPVPNAVGAGILRLLDDVELAARLAHNARLLAAHSYSQDEYHRKVAEVFAFLAAKTRSRA